MAGARAANTRAISGRRRTARMTASTPVGRTPATRATRIALVFAALATAIGSSLKDMQGFQMVMNFLVMALWFLSGALYPLQGLPAALAVLTRIDPLTYGVDGVRGILIGTADFGGALDLAVLLGVGVLFVIAGAWRFSKIEV